MNHLKSHTLTESTEWKEIIVEKRPLLDMAGNEIEGLYNHWILFNNPNQYNSYTTQAVKEVIHSNKPRVKGKKKVITKSKSAGKKKPVPKKIRRK